MGSHLRKLTKTGCGKPGARPFAFTLASALITLVFLGSSLTFAATWAVAAGGEVGGEEAPLPAGTTAYKPGEVLVKFADVGAAERIVSFLDLLGLSDAAREIFQEGGYYVEKDE